MMLTIELFFQTLCEKIFRSLIIMLSYHSQLNKLIVVYSHEVFDTL